MLYYDSQSKHQRGLRIYRKIVRAPNNGSRFITRIFSSGIVACLLVVTFLFPAAGYGQGFDTLRIATYNILNYPGSTAATRNPEFRKVIHTLNPDLLVVQELTSAAGMNQFLTQVLNAYTPGLYAAAPFHDGPDSDNGLFYKPSKWEFLGASYIPTALRDIAGYVVRPVASQQQLRIYSVHLKASSGSANEQARLAEATILRTHLDSLPAGTAFLIMGDFNIYHSNEPAFQTLVGVGSNPAGQAFDPLNLIGTWNSNPAFALHHTQSPRVRAFDGGATGGLDDRFDMILTSSTTFSRIITSTYVAYGNDGNHFNDSINRLPNAAVPDSVAFALHAASDHLPVAASFVFETSIVPVQLAYFHGALNATADSVILQWGTISEINNYGFYVQRRTAAAPAWWTIENSFMPGHGTTLEPQHYRFAEAIPAAGTILYRLKQLDLDGTPHYAEPIQLTTLTSVATTLPASISLSQNYPNPFNAQTVIEFQLPQADDVSLAVFDVLGRTVRVLFEGEAQAGRTYRVVLDANDLAAGVYAYRLTSLHHPAVTKKLILVK